MLMSFAFFLTLCPFGASAWDWGVDCKPDKSPPSCSDKLKAGSLCTMSCDDPFIRPTQYALGLQLIACKVSKYNNKTFEEMQDYMKADEHVLPGVIGPGQKFYVTANHHTLNAVCKSHHRTVHAYFCPRADFSSTGEEFWSVMENHKPKLFFLQDEKGAAISHDQLPDSVYPGMVKDDPYRSLSELVMHQGGYVKCGDPLFRHWKQCKEDKDLGVNKTAYFENVWADVIRKTVPLPDIYEMEPEKQIEPLVHAVPAAVTACGSEENKAMPGFNKYPGVNITNCTLAERTGCDCKTGPKAVCGKALNSAYIV